ncbi:MAG: endonuclease MutS2 [Chloroflexota bacterium]|nr:endonuclease MutS2 [Chloroflexota bacterium]
MKKHWQTLDFHKILAKVAERTSFSAGRELALALEPTSNLVEAQARQEETTEARRLFDVKGSVSIGGAHDVRPLVERADRDFRLLPPDLLDIQSTLESGKRLKRTLTRLRDQFPRLADHAAGIEPCPQLIAEIARCINDQGEVLDSASDELARIRRDKNIAHQRLMDRLQGMISSPKYTSLLQEFYVTERSGRYVIPLKAEFKGRIPGLVHDQSASGATLFIEPLSVVELNNNWRQLQLDEEKEIERILATLSEMVAQEGEFIRRTVNALAYLDMTFAKARYAEDTKAVEPQMIPFRDAADEAHPGSTLRLLQARHPLLDPQRVVPIDVHLGRSYFILVITGPNTGGKTVSLKTVGLLSLMAQTGLHIPAAEGSVLSVFDGIYADIGDEQSIEQSLSTFSSHMNNIISILDQADSHSLVLFDELGAGTDPTEGSALARALLDHVRQRRITTLAATHSSELKVYAQETPSVRNASVQFDLETLAPTFELLIGLPGQSNALAIAERLGLSEHITNQARGWLTPQQLETESLLREVQEAHKEADEERDAAAQAREEVEALRRELEERLEAIEEERRQVLRAARTEAEEVLAELRTEVAQLRSRQEVVEVEQAETLVEELAPPEAPSSHEGTAPPEELTPGDIVWVASLGKEGQLLELDDTQAEVQVGQFRVKVDSRELKPRQVEPNPEERAEFASIRVPRPSPGLELEVRGLRVQDALERVDKYLDQAYLAQMPFVHIIHGKGTGRLRRAVRELLDGHPQVRDFRPGDRFEGGDGITVVRLMED